jgi:hypothetical protein
MGGKETVMNMNMKLKLVVGVMVAGALCAGTSGAAEDSSGLELRLTYIPAVQDIGDWYEDYLERDRGGWVKVEADVSVFPVGLSMAYRWDMASVIDGGFIYADLGPAAVMFGDASFWMIPIGGGVGYEVARESAQSFYGKLGLRYPLAGGDAVDGSSPGLLLAGGMEFAKSDSRLWFVEAAFDTSTINFDDDDKSKDIDLGLMISVGLKF